VIYDKDRHTFVETPDPHAKTGRQKLSVKLGIRTVSKPNW